MHTKATTTTTTTTKATTINYQSQFHKRVFCYKLGNLWLGLNILQQKFTFDIFGLKVKVKVNE